MTTTDEGSVNVVNESSDPLGAGWSVGGLQQLSQLTTDGPVLITAGQQGTEAFQPAYSDGQTYIQDLALATTHVRRPDHGEQRGGRLLGDRRPLRIPPRAPSPAISTATASPTWPSSPRRP